MTEYRATVFYVVRHHLTRARELREWGFHVHSVRALAIANKTRLAYLAHIQKGA